MKKNPAVKCELSGKIVPPSKAVPAESIPDGIAELIRKDYPEWSRRGYVCRDELNRYRTAYVGEVLRAEEGELSALEREVVDSLAQQEVLSRNINEEFETRLTLGQRVADRVAAFGGSWRFILIFTGALAAWIGVNSIVLLWRPFDPYPFIFLNLILSCLAALQAPVIMMSQNRLEAKDRLRGEHDYVLNLKAELEIRYLHEKIDYLLRDQWQRLLEIQQLQMDLMEELASKREVRRRPRRPPKNP
jgi:uncharacterized membrane protein